MRVNEFVHTVGVKHLRVRAWCAVSGFDRQAAEAQAAEVLLAAARAPHMTPEAVAEAVARLPYCNAVEVTPADGATGVLIYPEWP